MASCDPWPVAVSADQTAFERAWLRCEHGSAHLNVAKALKELGRSEEAMRQLLYALEIAPRYPEGLELLREMGR